MATMNNSTARYVQMPQTAKYPNGHKLPLRDRVLVVIGANGSGKTRLGVWLEQSNIIMHHRISAHRSLNFPEIIYPTDLDAAERHLLNGDPRKDLSPNHRRLGRWQENPATVLLNDFTPLLTVIVSENFSVSDQYRLDMKSVTEYKTPPKTRMDIIKEIWEEVLPDRELVVTGSRIETRNREDTSIYHPKEMSDGERAIFYLIAEALCVPEDGIFIVDEPELHLHRAIQARLWDAVEVARPDCTFVYITHDLGFASSRKAANKVWLREYANEKWDWEEVPESDAFPESLLLEVMGSRRPILFVEGDRSSLDYLIYGKTFRDYTVLPCGSCELVIHSVCSFTQMPSLHHNKCAGIIDNDGRSESDIKLLNGLGITVLPVALVENLLLLESILFIATEKLGHDPAEAVTKVKERVFAILEKDIVRVISNLTRMEIEAGLRTFGKVDDGIEALTTGYKDACNAIDPGAIYARWEKELRRVIEEKDYPAALRYYKTKGLHREAGCIFSIKFQDQILRWLRADDSAALVTAFRAAIPQIPIVAR